MREVDIVPILPDAKTFLSDAGREQAREKSTSGIRAFQKLRTIDKPETKLFPERLSKVPLWKSSLPAPEDAYRPGAES